MKPTSLPTSIRAVFSVFLILSNLLGIPVFAQAPPVLNLVIVEGEGAINNVKQRVNRDPIVQVEDENHRPIAGAAVIFFLPDQGASGTFVNGSRTLTVMTNAQGRAVATGIRPNNVNGPMQIRVTASFQGATASAVINQMNTGGSGSGSGSTAGGGGGLSTGAKVAIILLIAGGAAAGGIVAATHGGGGSGGSASIPPGIVITAGTPSVGAPK
ncbi:MAG TPA: hypothetical protein VN841_15780 [Bryobacteraceae bacterium]|nr:hypothetical protein [Bryobacteraceae bacterium]